MPSRRLTGRFPETAIGMIEVPRPPPGVTDALMAVQGVTCLVSDILDSMGIVGTLSASRLRPAVPGRTIAGPALTIRKVPLPELRADAREERLGDIEAHNLISPGDVLVMDGVENVSNMGGIAARLSKRQGSVGAIIWGGSRDVADLTELDYPIWSTSVTPVSGIGRIDTVELNRDIAMGGIPVACGDIVVADDNGVCFIPRRRVEEVVQKLAQRLDAERKRIERIDAGLPVPVLAQEPAK